MARVAGVMMSHTDTVRVLAVSGSLLGWVIEDASFVGITEIIAHRAGSSPARWYGAVATLHESHRNISVGCGYL